MPPLPTHPVHPFDRQYGTDTGGLIPRDQLRTGHRNDAHVTAYYAVAPSILTGAVDLWLESRPLLPIDRYTFLDVGAGKGRAMLCAAQQPFREVVGIELNPGLAAIARANLRLFEADDDSGALAPIRLLEGDALTVPLPLGPTVAFLFHPFEAPVLRRFLARAERHWTARGESFDLIYVNAEHAAAIEAPPFFTRLFQGTVPMSPADHAADLLEIAEQTEYGSTGDEHCALYRLTV